MQIFDKNNNLIADIIPDDTSRRIRRIMQDNNDKFINLLNENLL
jgi:hypothetical protein